MQRVDAMMRKGSTTSEPNEGNKNTLFLETQIKQT